MPQPCILIVQGWRGSGPGHWRTVWQRNIPCAQRVEQDNWVAPTRSSWVAKLESYVIAATGPVAIVAHSLGCIAAIHLGGDAAARIHGALLVAPADPQRRAILSDFAPVPRQRLPYRSIVVASSNDPFCTARLASAYARAWASKLVRVPDAGHINVESGHGEWPLGLALLQSLVGNPAVASAYLYQSVIQETA